MHPAQADVVEEAEVSPQGEVVAVAPAAALHRGPAPKGRGVMVMTAGWAGYRFRGSSEDIKEGDGWNSS